MLLLVCIRSHWNLFIKWVIPIIQCIVLNTHQICCENQCLHTMPFKLRPMHLITYTRHFILSISDVQSHTRFGCIEKCLYRFYSTFYLYLSFGMLTFEFQVCKDKLEENRKNHKASNCETMVKSRKTLIPQRIPSLKSIKSKSNSIIKHKHEENIDKVKFEVLRFKWLDDTTPGLNSHHLLCNAFLLHSRLIIYLLFECFEFFIHSNLYYLWKAGVTKC